MCGRKKMSSSKYHVGFFLSPIRIVAAIVLSGLEFPVPCPSFFFLSFLHFLGVTFPLNQCEAGKKYPPLNTTWFSSCPRYALLLLLFSPDWSFLSHVPSLFLCGFFFNNCFVLFVLFLVFFLLFFFLSFQLNQCPAGKMSSSEFHNFLPVLDSHCCCY